MTVRGRTWSTPTGRLARVLSWTLLAAALPWALAQAECPLLLSPAAGEVMDNGRRDRLDDVVWDFRWSACEGADAYQLVAFAPGASVPTVGVETAATATTATMAGEHVEDEFLEGWTWRVRAGAGGDWGPWSEERAFAVEPPDSDPPMAFGAPGDCPVLLTPASGAVLDNGRSDRADDLAWSFAWTACPGAWEYLLLVVREGAERPAVAVNLRATEYVDARVGAVLAATETEGWTWRVRAKVGRTEWLPWSAPNVFTVEPPDRDLPRPELVTPELVEPTAGTVVRNAGGYPPPRTGWPFAWTRVADADGYRLQVTAPHLPEPFFDVALELREDGVRCDLRIGLCGFNVDPGSLPLPSAGDWVWRVQARFGTAWGPWSEAGAFAVAPLPAGAALRIEGRLEGWAHGPGRIEGFMHPDVPPLGTGQIAADGSFWFSLPPLTFDDAGEATTGERPLPAVYVVSFHVIQEEVVTAYAALATSLEAANLHWTRPRDVKSGDAMVMWWLTDRAATWTGSQGDRWREDRYELDLRQGWNTVLLRAIEVDEPPFVTQSTVVVEPPDDVAWHWHRYGE